MKSEIILTENELPSEVIEAIQGGRKLEAIKLLRESKDLGLANAKVLVERAWRTHGPAKQFRSFADEPRGLSNFVKSLAMLLFVVAAWYFYNGA